MHYTKYFGLAMVVLIPTFGPDARSDDTAGGASSPVQLLKLGAYHGDEVQAVDGEEWWAAMRTKAGLELRPVRIQVRTVFDPIVDAEGEATGKEVFLAEPVDDATCLFLVKGLENPSEGSLSTVFEGYLFVNPGQFVNFGTGAFRISLSGLGSTSPEGTASYQLVARALPSETGDGEMSEAQILYSVSGMHEGPPFDGACGVVEWIGDLDGDGRWDFIVNQTDHYNVNQPALFLSTLAGDGEIAGKAAEFRTTGC